MLRRSVRAAPVLQCDVVRWASGETRARRNDGPWRGGGAPTTDRRRRRGARLRGTALCRQPGIARGGLSLLLLFLVDPPVQLSQCEVQRARDVGLDAAGTAGTAADGTYRRRRPGYCVVGRTGTASLTTTHSMRRTVTVVGLVAGLRGVVGRLLRWVLSELQKVHVVFLGAFMKMKLFICSFVPI